METTDMRHLHILVVAAAALAAVAAPASAQRDYDRSYSYDSSFASKNSIASGGTIRVENLNGSIDVEASDNATTTVTAVKKWRRGDPSMVHIIVEPGRNGVTVCAIWNDQAKSCGDHDRHDNDYGDRHNDVSVQFTVHVAKGVKVDVNTVNGSVDVEGATASVDAETVNGRVEIATLGGPVTARTVNGSVRASIEHLISSSEPLELETTNGSVELAASPDLDADIDAETTNGGIQSDFPVTINSGLIGKHVHGTIGKGGRKVELHTTNGSVRLKKLG
jgi:putative adhesin